MTSRQPPHSSCFFNFFNLHLHPLYIDSLFLFVLPTRNIVSLTRDTLCITSVMVR